MSDDAPSTEARIAAFRENLLTARLSIYGAGFAVLAGMIAAAYLPMGHPLAVCLATMFVLCTVLGLGIGAYVIRREGS